MYFTPEEIAVLEKNPIYRRLSRAQYSSISIATLQNYIDGVVTPGVENLPLIKYLLYLLKAKENESNNGLLTTIDSDTGYVKNYTLYGANGAILSASPTVSAIAATMYDVSYALAYNKHRRLAVFPFTSNAGGTLDADVTLVAALAGYYGVFRILGIWSSGAETPTWELEDDDGALVSLTTPAHVAGRQMTDLEGYTLWGGTDNKNLIIDTTSANLGNAVSYRWLIEYWYET